ncbi:ABC transporter C family member 8 [Camellia lanceoleosa]|uniref:ABC transporter C family member 8 n=1 Tax=Camellia lanceoleosa TaxID=1840588 RepID=A0ACC0IAW5_9ERIC|nr:ABC transporter C family member 8 [Camellia lanceoleosa]
MQGVTRWSSHMPSQCQVACIKDLNRWYVYSPTVAISHHSIIKVLSNRMARIHPQQIPGGQMGMYPQQTQSGQMAYMNPQQMYSNQMARYGYGYGGNVGWKPFLDYILVSKGSLMLSSVIITQIGFVALQAVSSYWLAFGIQIPKIGSGILIGVYTTISTISTLFVCLRSLSAALLGLKASKAFFSDFTNSIFNAPMLFFDSTPVGRILTRASSDLCVVDFDIPFSFAFVVAPLIESVAIIGIMASVTWQVLFVAFFVTVASKYVQGYYQASARELMRINGTTKAPIMNYAAETSLGVVTIRAFNMANRFFQNYLKLVDNDAKLFFYSNATMEWLILRVEALQNLTLFTAIFLLVLLPKGYVDPLVGLSLSYALALTSTQVFMIRWYSGLANYIISKERIKQFMHIPPEPPAIVEDRRPPSSWPSKGG